MVGECAKSATVHRLAAQHSRRADALNCTSPTLHQQRMDGWEPTPPPLHRTKTSPTTHLLPFIVLAWPNGQICSQCRLTQLVHGHVREHLSLRLGSAGAPPGCGSGRGAGEGGGVVRGEQDPDGEACRGPSLTTAMPCSVHAVHWIRRLAEAPMTPPVLPRDGTEQPPQAALGQRARWVRATHRRHSAQLKCCLVCLGFPSDRIVSGGLSCGGCCSIVRMS
jgi:hypothetical protein